MAPQLMKRAFGRLFVVPGRWTWRWNWQAPLHRLLHRSQDKACLVCVSVWAYLDSAPGFSARLDAAEAELAAGKGHLYRVEDLD